MEYLGHLNPTVIPHNVMIPYQVKADEPLLWNIYGQRLPIVLPYKSFLRLSIPCTSHSLKFHKFGHCIYPIIYDVLTIPYLTHTWACMGHNLPYQTHTFTLVRVGLISSAGGVLHLYHSLGLKFPSALIFLLLLKWHAYCHDRINLVASLCSSIHVLHSTLQEGVLKLANWQWSLDICPANLRFWLVNGEQTCSLDSSVMKWNMKIYFSLGESQMWRWMFNIMAVMNFDLFIFADDVSHVKCKHATHTTTHGLY